ncbi:MAG: class II aldolase/adducin family protein [Lactobacillus iners]|nr:class II aldolase/adducin family protein [Lactobacillus iners]MCT7809990.1 class II aldolase/adducin family protein [Lactobacillus iners]MCT7813865.1 class II aldolase/adducin family protein [Lactobacillus iners]MCT7830091.1 class II aldolase/adducin family protein [Lactobacillus iners]MCT7844166.1 class II aldolase/adducin family protein [Lactobacillus iners]
MYEKIKSDLIETNMKIYQNNLAKLTWGNVSYKIPNQDIFLITPSGVEVKDLNVDKIIVLDINMNIIEGKLRPSVDGITHSIIYKNFPSINSIVHTHSPNATAFAQAEKNIPVLGTTHADTFGAEIRNIPHIKNTIAEYEAEVGHLVVSTVQKQLREEVYLKNVHAVLLRKHGVLTFGSSLDGAINYAIALEEIANIAIKTYSINTSPTIVDTNQLKIHFERKNGNNKYYGQKG